MKKLTKILLLSLVLILIFGAVSASAYDAYDTYTYSIDGEPLKSPAAYTASLSLSSASMNLLKSEFGGVALKGVSDIVTDGNSNVYLADRDNNRIVVLNKYYSAVKILSEYVDEYGQHQTFSAPEGVFVTDANENGPGYIYVCDTQNRRIVVFDKNYEYVRTFGKPENDILKEDAYKPKAVAVDLYGRIFVISEYCYEGVIVMSSEGDFTGFIGAQEKPVSMLTLIWRNFQTRAQRLSESTKVSASYNNITVDAEGFIYVTNSNIDAKQQISTIKSKSSLYSPVKKLNSAGREIMKRNGFFDPGGEVAVSTFSTSIGPSKIIDVAMGPEGSWSILDTKRSRIFTYDDNGNLLFAFGDTGAQLGNANKNGLVAITYHEVGGVYQLLAVERNDTGDSLIVYSPTAYCDTIISALRNQNENKFSESIDFWQQVLKRNNNFDLAYIGIGKALYGQGKYQEAMETLSNAYETDTYSDAFSQVRKDLMSSWVLGALLVGAIAGIVGLVKFFGWAKKKNKATSLKVGKKTYVEELVYVFHLWMHPFDGFWDLKHEKRGSVRAGTTILGLTVLAFFYQAIGRGYPFNPKGDYSTVFVQLLSVIVPVALWCVGNWCLTSLFEGEGSFKDIYVATTYALAPLPILVTISTVLTNVLTLSEGSIVTLLVSIGYIWAALLLFFGILVTHDYSLGKNLLIVICTIVAMLIIMFVAILFSSLLIKMITFISAIFTEIGNRI